MYVLGWGGGWGSQPFQFESDLSIRYLPSFGALEAPRREPGQSQGGLRKDPLR